jgi:hypothetical protein
VKNMINSTKGGEIALRKEVSVFFAPANNKACKIAYSDFKLVMQIRTQRIYPDSGPSQ